MQTLPQPRFADKAESYDKHAQVQMEAANWLAEWLPETAENKKNF